METAICIEDKNGLMCTGCMVCMDSCSQNAITEDFTMDGFRIPRINKEKCVKCGRCKKVCSINQVKKVFSPINVYRIAAKDNSVRMKCSSGGVFALLSEKMIERGGIVIGAVFDPKSKDIRHATSDEFALNQIYRSKYVQSNTIGIYHKTEQILKEGRDVLFCGTPCQIRALCNYLNGKNYAGNVLTVDFMCHGIPSTMEFRDFIEEREKEEKSPIIDVTFREKDIGWRTQILKTYHKNGRIWKKTSYYYYYYMFLNNYSLRDSCYMCGEYNTHMADITLADDWNGNNNDDLGTSLLFMNTLNGKNATSEILDSTEYSDATRNVMSNIGVYSHAKYDYSKKILWKEALRDGGYKKAKTSLFYKTSFFPLLNDKLRRRAFTMKQYLKRIVGGGKQLLCSSYFGLSNNKKQISIHLYRFRVLSTYCCSFCSIKRTKYIMA